MKKKILLIFIVLSLTMNLYGCDSDSPDIIEEMPTITLCTIESVTDEVENEVNHILQKKKYDFIVDFITVDSYKQDKELIDQADISQYFDEIEDDFILLDAYFDTEEGREFQKLQDEKIWQLATINHKRILIPKPDICGYSMALEFDKKILDKYGLKKEELGKTLDELGSVFLEVYEGEGEEFIVYQARGSEIHPLKNHYQVMQDLFYIDKEADDPVVKNIYEEKDVIEYFRTIDKLYNQGLSGKKLNDIEYADKVQEGQYFCTLTRFSNQDFIDAYQQKLDYKKEYVVLGNSYMGDLNCYASYGIKENSAYKDQAWTLLKEIFSDKDISNLLIHGIEGVDYQLQDGKAVSPWSESKILSVGHSHFLGNNTIAYSCVNEVAEKIEKTKEYMERQYPYSFMGFKPDFSNCVDEYIQVQAVLENHIFANTGIMAGRSKDLEQELIAIREELEEAGADRIQQDIQQQLEKFKGYKFETKR